MTDTIGYQDVVAMCQAAAAKIRANEALLSGLDSHGGDGDHGTTITRAMGLVEQAIDADTSNELKTLLYDIGWAVMGVDGGATGPLFGMFFMGMSNAVEGEALDGPAVAAMFEAALASVQMQTKAKVGDKTMIDALVPAVEALRRAVDAGASPTAALDAAAAAAAQGAQSTIELQARFGRAKSIGEGSKGYADPGATSASFMFQGFSEALGSA